MNQAKLVGPDVGAAKYPERNLLTVWPNYDRPWTHEMLESFQGGYLAYVGEGEGGCTGDA